MPQEPHYWEFVQSATTPFLRDAAVGLFSLGRHSGRVPPGGGQPLQTSRRQRASPAAALAGEDTAFAQGDFDLFAGRRRIT